MELFALAAALFWVALTLSRARSWPAEMLLDPDRRAVPVLHRSVVAVIPARNEALTLAQTLPPLLAQPELARVVVVDDASDDGTAEVARAAAAAAGRAELVRVIRSTPPPEGWWGKVWALESGLAAVESEPSLTNKQWLLFTDADILHRAGSVASLVARAGSERDLVSVMARLRTESFWERLLVPTFVYFFQLLYPFRRVAEPGSKVAAAAGGCVLVRRETLRAAGGLGAIAGAVIDDVALARAVAAAGGRLWLGLDAGIRSLRPYPRLADLWRMVARSAYDQLGYRLDLLALVVLGLGLFFVAPPLLAATGASRALAGDAGAGRTALWAAIALALEVRALRPAAAHHGLGWPWAFALPLSSLLFGAMTLGSAWAHYSGRGVGWRGRRIGRNASPE